MNYVHYSANPKHKDMSVNDCSVRSIAKAEDRPWQDVMRNLCDIAIEECLMPNDYRVVSKYMTDRYGANKREIFTDDYVTLAEFIDEHPEGAYAVQVTGHGVAVVDGVIYDLMDSSQDMVISSWRVK